MLKIKYAEVFGWEAAIRGMRNPKNSWANSDSWFEDCLYHIGEKDHELMHKLSATGPDHAKFLRMVHVSCDINAPLYWWKEMDQYKVGTVTDSCSTMHKIHSKEFSIDDFSHEHLVEGSITRLNMLIDWLNTERSFFNESKNKDYWWQLIQLLPSSYNQLRTWDANYAVLKNIYHARKDHKLNEWVDFCKWIETLPYAELITGKETDNVE